MSTGCSGVALHLDTGAMAASSTPGNRCSPLLGRGLHSPKRVETVWTTARCAPTSVTAEGAGMLLV